MGPWLNIEDFDDFGDEGVACFEEAVITRHYDAGMCRERRLEVSDTMRWKARK